MSNVRPFPKASLGRKKRKATGKATRGKATRGGAKVTKMKVTKRKSAKKSRRGGARPGAGRPKGQGPYGEATKPIRIPLSRIDEVLRFIRKREQYMPLYSCAVAAGSPAVADDHREGSLDLNEYLIDKPGATFFVRVSGDSMIGAGIHEDDILVVNRDMPAKEGKIIIAAVDGELTVKRLARDGATTMLLPENPDFKPIIVSNPEDMVIWGVVTSVIHKV